MRIENGLDDSDADDVTRVKLLRVEKTSIEQQRHLSVSAGRVGGNKKGKRTRKYKQSQIQIKRPRSLYRIWSKCSIGASCWKRKIYRGNLIF
ncbi:unnamed protein product [Caretta caretta]